MFNPSRHTLSWFRSATKEEKKAAAKKKAASEPPKFSVRDPRHDIAAKKDVVRKTRMVNVLLPLSVLFVFGAAISVIIDSQKQKESGAVCVNCDRQREIAEEIYFNKKRPKAEVPLIGGTTVR